jgi:hypothetical protein
MICATTDTFRNIQFVLRIDIDSSDSRNSYPTRISHIKQRFSSLLTEAMRKLDDYSSISVNSDELCCEQLACEEVSVDTASIADILSL